MRGRGAHVTNTGVEGEGYKTRELPDMRERGAHATNTGVEGEGVQD